MSQEYITLLRKIYFHQKLPEWFKEAINLMQVKLNPELRYKLSIGQPLTKDELKQFGKFIKSQNKRQKA